MMKGEVLLMLILSCIMKCSYCCFQNFPRLSEVQSARNTIPNEVSRQYIFPELQITCDTEVYYIIYKGDPFNPQATSSHPVIQLYKKTSSSGYRHLIEFYNLRSVSQGDGSTTILTLKNSMEIDVDDDDGVYVLGVFLPSGASFHFESKTNATPAYYVETESRYQTLSTQDMIRQDNVLPLIAMLTDSDSVPTISSKSTTSSSKSTTSSSISTTSSSISTTKSSLLPTVTTSQWSSSVSTAVNTPTATGQSEESARMYKVVITPILSVLVVGLVTGFVVVTCVLAYRLNKAKATISNNQLTHETLNSSDTHNSSGFSIRYDKTNHQRQEQHSSMIINESYEKTTPSPQVYSILNFTKRDVESSNSSYDLSTSSSDFGSKEHCQTNPSYVPSNPLPTCPLMNQGIPTCHQYEDPNMFLTPNNYECPQAISNIEIPNYKEETII